MRHIRALRFFVRAGAAEKVQNVSINPGRLVVVGQTGREIISGRVRVSSYGAQVECAVLE